MKKRIKYDVFVSHASVDKIAYVDKLVEAIKRTGLKVFYDTDSIYWGDKITDKIDDGLTNCRRAVVVISNSYFGRKWTEYEIMVLLNRQNKEGTKIIMPVLHRINKKTLVDHYPELANISFVYSSNCSCEKLAKLLYNDIKSRR